MKITKQRLKQIIKEELSNIALAEEEPAPEGPEVTSKQALATFMKEKYEFLMGSESANMSLSTAEIHALAEFVNKILGLAGGKSNAAVELNRNLKRLDTGSAAKELEKDVPQGPVVE